MGKNNFKEIIDKRNKEIGIESKARGITLISLVVLIIILVILTTITTATLKQSSLFKNSKKAKENYEIAKQDENNKLNEYTETINSSRETVTLTAEEYNMFKSQFSQNTDTQKVSINKPSTWKVNTEYDFGDNIYGIRYIGTCAGSTSMEIGTITNIDYLVQWGGNNYSNGATFALPTAYKTDGMDVYADRTTGKIIIYFDAGWNNNFNYNIWITYNKKIN